MGALDFLKEFEGRVLDAATYQLLKRNYELQEENNRQLKETVERLKERLESSESEVDLLREENGRLTQRLAEQTTEDQFAIHGGFAFKRNATGEYDPTGYCPTCKVVMGNPIRSKYQCSKCEYLTTSRTRPDVLAQQLNAKSE